MPDQGSYDPVVVLADQVVAGTNYAYLVKECSVTSMAPFDLTAYVGGGETR